MESSIKTKLLSTLIVIAILAISPPNAFSQEATILKERRQKLASLVENGIAIIQSTERNQNNLYEYFPPNSDNHDFIYLTGLETPGATLILCPGSEEYPEILYIKGDPQEIQIKTGIEHVYDPENLLPDLSNAYTDFSLLRNHQIKGKPLPSEISRIIYNYGEKKVIYFNFPRFVNLGEPSPKRLELIHRIQYLSPKYEIRDVSDFMDMLRMYHDEYGLEQLRTAARISGEAMIECMKSVKPGMNQEHLRAVFNFVCNFKGAKNFGFPTTVNSGPRRHSEHFPRYETTMNKGELATIDAGAEINYYTADIQRTFPVSGKFTEEQKKIYNILKKAQEACIKMVRPGITFNDLQEKAQQVLDEEGGYGKYFLGGIGHFLGMDVHDHGNYLLPFKPGIAITVEPNLALPEFRVVLEDDVVCTEDGYEWLTEFIPREVGDIEKIMQEKGIGETFFEKN